MKKIIGFLGLGIFVVGVFIRLVASTWGVLAISLFVTGIVLITLWAVLRREALKELLKGRKLFYGINVVVLVIIVLGIVVAVNYVSTNYYHRWDLTANRQFTLSQETNKVLKGLRHGLKITAFFEVGTGQSIRDLLADYAYRSKEVKYEVVDPEKEPTIAQSYGISSNGVIVITYNGKTIKTSQATESGITNAIVKLLRNKIINVCYITGHGEKSLSDMAGVDGYGAFKQALMDQDYSVKELLLPSIGAIPTDCSVLIDAGAIKPFFPNEIDVLKKYLQDGGHMLVMIDPLTNSGIIKFLSKYNIEVGNNVVLDQVVRLFQGPSLGVEPIVKQYSLISDITKDFKGDTIFPLVRTVSPGNNKNPDYSIDSIAKTSNTSWSDADLKILFSKGIAKFDPKVDTKGPLSVAVQGTLKFGNNTARLVVFGTSRMVTNKYINALYNKDLVMNSISWLSKEENLITIRPKPANNQQMFLTQSEGKLILYMTVILIPLLLFFGGILAYTRMKRL